MQILLQGAYLHFFPDLRHYVERRLSYALGGAKDNPEMESFISRFKSEGHSLFLDAHSLTELAEVVDQRMQYHNVERLHSSIGYRSPLDFIQQVTVVSTPEVHI